MAVQHGLGASLPADFVLVQQTGTGLLITKSGQKPTGPLSPLCAEHQGTGVVTVSPRFRGEVTPWGTSSAERAVAIHGLCSSSLRAPLCWLSPSRVTPKQQCTAMHSEWHRNHPADMETPRIFDRYPSLLSKWIGMPEGFCWLLFATGADFPPSPRVLLERIYTFTAENLYFYSTPCLYPFSQSQRLGESRIF